MKKLLLFGLSVVLFCSCNKGTYNFDVYQIVNLQTLNQTLISCPGKVVTLELAYDNLTYDEVNALLKQKTFSYWTPKNDTVWVLKNYSHKGKKFDDIWFVYSDSVLYTSYVKSHMLYFCP